jgi:predicted nucleic acid-binding protein
MPLVVADTSPVFYLLSIGQIDLLPLIFGRILVPDEAYRELSHPTAPEILRRWTVECPDWLEVNPVGPTDDDALLTLGAGERAAIALALATHADLILIDERKGTSAALAKGLEVTGTLGILRLAARRGAVDLRDALVKLRRTNFRYRQQMLDDLLKEFTDGL